MGLYISGSNRKKIDCLVYQLLFKCCFECCSGSKKEKSEIQPRVWYDRTMRTWLVLIKLSLM